MCLELTVFSFKVSVIILMFVAVSSLLFLEYFDKEICRFAFEKHILLLLLFLDQQAASAIS